MSRSRFARVFRRAGASTVALGLVGSLFVAVAPPAQASSPPLASFEIDGNLALNDGATPLIDWATAGSDSRITEFKTFGDDGASYLDSAKEQDPSTWACAANEAPPKDDLLRLYLASQITTADQFLHVGYVRATGTGDTDINIEFNRTTSGFNCADNPDGFNRTPGDFMISFTFPGGDGAAVVDAYRWDPPPDIDVENDFDTNDGHWTLLTEHPAFEGATNSGTVADPLHSNESLAPRTFGELTVDLSSFFEDGLLSCPGAGFVTPHSRASHDFASDLKDVLPEQKFDLSDCGSLKLKKVNDLGHPMQGVTFGLYEDNNGTKGDLVEFEGEPLTCETDASGICFIGRVPSDSYFIDEVSAPAGYDKDPRLPYHVTISSFTLLDLSDTQPEWFVNTRQVGSVTITKTLTDSYGNPIDITDVNKNDYSPYISGVSFALKQGGATAAKRNGSPATCSTGAIDLATDSASCTIDLVLYGSYTLHENVPAGTSLPTGQQDRTVVVDAGPASVPVSFTNILNPDILVLKVADTPAVNAGDQVGYTLTVSNAGDAPALGVVLTDHLNANVTGWASSQPNPPCSIVAGLLTCNIDRLNPGASFNVTLTGTATPAACPRITNQALVSATNETSEDASNNDSAIVPITVNCPDVSILKSTSTPTVDAGDPVKFSIVVHNGGLGDAYSVAFSDDLPNSVTWSFDGSAPAECSLDGSNNLSCSWPTLDAGATVTINLKGTADAGDCPSLSNPVITVRASNEASSATGNNSTGPVEITVNCPSVKVEKTGNGPINSGDVAVYTITVRNIGLGEATNVHVTDTLPAGVTWVAGAGFPAGCSITGGALDCTFPSIVAAGSISISVQGTTDASDCPSITNVLVSATPSNGQGDTAGPAVIEVNCPDMVVTKVGNGPISGGDPDHPAQYTITITNDGPGVAKDASFTDHLPAGLNWSAGTPFPEACSLENGTLSCSWATFAPGSVTIVVQAMTSDANCPSIQNPISSVTASNEAAGTLGNNSTGLVDIVINCPDLGMSKVADAGSVSRGDPVGFSMKVWNSGLGASFGTTLTDPLPAGFNWDYSAAGSTLPEGASCSVNDATNTLTCDLGTLAARSSQEEPAAVVHVVAANTLPAACGPYENTASVASDNGGSARDSAAVTLLCPGVNIAKDADADLVDAGGAIGYTLEVSNTGPGEAKDVVVTDVLPGSFAWGIDTAGSELPEGAECTVTDGVLTCNLGDIAARDAVAATIHIVAQTSVPTGNTGTGECGPYSNVASAVPANGDGAVSGIVDLEVRCPLAIDLIKKGPDLAHVGDTVTYQFTVTNTGYVDLVDVNLADPICDAGSPIRISNGDGDAVLEIDTDASKDGLQREVWTYSCSRLVRATDPDPLPNTATVTGTDADQRTTTDTASWLVDLIHPAISIVKTASPESVSVSGPVTYTYVVTNTGDTTLFNLVVDDDILGTIGTIGQLLPGQSVTLAKTVEVNASTPPRNIGTAVGTDVLGQSVSANDDAIINVVLAEVLAQPELPRTGAPLTAETRAALMMIEVGIVMILAGRRRRAGRWAD